MVRLSKPLPSLIAVVLMTFAVATDVTAGSFSPPPLRSRGGQFTLVRPIQLAPSTPVRALDGTMADLGRFRGKVVVLNFWATWCAPCVYEMPALDRLAATSDRSRFAVVAVSIDREGADVVAPFVAAHSLTHLAVYLDPNQRLGSLGSDHVAVGALPLWGLPITYIIDKDGRVIGYLTGAAKWDSAAAGDFLEYVFSHAAS